MVTPPDVFSLEFIQFVAEHDQECFELLMKQNEGYLFKELAEVYSKTEQQLRQRAVKCRSKFAAFWKGMNSNKSVS
jgi:hypothetical protein